MRLIIEEIYGKDVTVLNKIINKLNENKKNIDFREEAEEILDQAYFVLGITSPIEHLIVNIKNLTVDNLEYFLLNYEKGEELFFEKSEIKATLGETLYDAAKMANNQSILQYLTKKLDLQLLAQTDLQVDQNLYQQEYQLSKQNGCKGYIDYGKKPLIFSSTMFWSSFPNTFNIISDMENIQKQNIKTSKENTKTSKDTTQQQFTDSDQCITSNENAVSRKKLLKKYNLPDNTITLIGNYKKPNLLL